MQMQIGYKHKGSLGKSARGRDVERERKKIWFNQYFKAKTKVLSP